MKRVLPIFCACIMTLYAASASALDKDLVRAISNFQVSILRGATVDSMAVNAKILDTEVRIASASKSYSGAAAAEIGRLMDSTTAVLDIWRSFKTGPCQSQVSNDDREKCVGDLKQLSNQLPEFDMTRVSKSFAKETEVVPQGLALLNAQGQRALEAALKN